MDRAALPSVCSGGLPESEKIFGAVCTTGEETFGRLLKQVVLDINRLRGNIEMGARGLNLHSFNNGSKMSLCVDKLCHVSAMGPSLPR